MSRSRDFADLAGSADAGGLTGRNLIINGAMTVAQRSTSTASITTSAYHTVDRWQSTVESLGTWTQSQSTDVPSSQGFASSLKMACTTADASPAAADRLFIRQNLEGQDLQHLKKGTASAESVTLSFWVKSSKTGTHIVNLLDLDNSRMICKTYTISSANTWEKQEILYVGDTAGAFDNDNGGSLQIEWWLASGSNNTSGTLQSTWGSLVAANRAVGQVNLADSTSNEWYITGIQLEVGDTATPFEHEDYGITLAKCQRYLRLGGAGVYGIYNSAANIEISIPFSPNMRAAPTLSMAKTSVSISNKTNSNTATATSVSATNISASPSGAFFAQIGNCNVTSAASGHIAQFRTDEFLQLDAEL